MDGSFGSGFDLGWMCCASGNNSGLRTCQHSSSIASRPQTGSAITSGLTLPSPSRPKSQYHLPQNDYSYKQEIKIENNRPASNHRHYRFIINRKQQNRIKITDVTDITVVTVYK